MALLSYVKLPMLGFQDPSFFLNQLRWRKKGEGSTGTAALMLYMALLHNANVKEEWDRPEPGTAALTYDELRVITGCSRAKIRDGLVCLQESGLIKTSSGITSRMHYLIVGFGQGQFAKMPCRSMYDEKLRRIVAFHKASLRSRHTLNGLKLFYYFGTRRSRDDNLAHVSHKNIQSRLKLRNIDILPAIRLLEEFDLVITHRQRPKHGRVHHAYRLRGVESRQHAGTSGRKGS